MDSGKARSGNRIGHSFAPARPPLPNVKNKTWPKNPIDYFVLARLEKEGLQPSPEADRATLLRRVSFDLTGLPPTLQELDDFLNDKSPNAYEKVVDRLLAFATLWRADGVQMAGCGALCRHERLSN